LEERLQEQAEVRQRTKLKKSSALKARREILPGFLAFQMFALFLAGPAVAFGNEPLHPLGDFDSLPAWPKKKHSEMVSLLLQPAKFLTSVKNAFYFDAEDWKALQIKIISKDQLIIEFAW
jgi:hypothetical protein